MDYGLYISASGVLTNMHRQDVAANNLANVNTASFKPDAVALKQRDAARIEDGLLTWPSNDLLERLGAGVLVEPLGPVMAQGPIEQSNDPLHLAVDGDGFLVAESTPNAEGETRRLTRDGRLTLDSTGTLVTASDGMAILDSGFHPIRLDPGLSVDIDEKGLISQGGQPVAQLAFLAEPAPRLLRKAGLGMFEAPTEVFRAGTRGAGRIRQHAVEGSGVNPVTAMLDVSGATAAVSSNARMIDLHMRVMDRAINSLGRVT